MSGAGKFRDARSVENFMKLIRRLALFVCFLSAAFFSNAQDFALKTNLLGWATTNLNIGAEIGTSHRTTVQVFGMLNPWDFGSNKHFRVWTLQPEFRYWLCERFNGWLFGVHMLGGEYNAKNYNFPLKGLIVGKDKWPDLTGDNSGRHSEGWYIGAGITAGYQWILSDHWNLEASIGVGYIYSPLKYYGRCDTCLEKQNLHYVGPTKAAVSFLYFF